MEVSSQASRIGAGGVGKCFLSQLEALTRRRPDPKLVLTYISTSKKALYSANYEAIGIEAALSSLPSSAQAPLSLPKLADYLGSAPAKVVLVDNTSSQDVADAYPLFLGSGVRHRDA